MTTVNNPPQCATCKKDNVTSKCFGCLQDFCFKHFVEHRQQLNEQLDQIEQDRDLFQQTLNQQTTNSQEHSLIQQIDRWEKESIEKIKQIAQEIREIVHVHINKNIISAKDQVNQLTEQLKYSREEDSVTEHRLNKWKEELEQLTEQMNKPSNILIKQTQTPLINEMQVQFPALLSIPVISDKARWMQNGITVAAEIGSGNGSNQLYSPYSICIDDDETIYVADIANNRILQWKKGATVGQVIAGGNGAGNRNDQLNGPMSAIVDRQNESLIILDTGNRRVVRWPCRENSSGETIISNISGYSMAMDNNGYLYVSDIEKHEVRRWKIDEKDGTLVAGGNGKGKQLDQLNTPYYIFVDQDQSVYVSDYENHRVVKWVKGAREGVVVAGGQGAGNGLKQLNNPVGIAVDQLGTVYVAEYSNHRVVRWLKGATEGTVVVGGNGQGEQSNHLNFSWNLSFDRQNNLYVLRCHNPRVKKFDIESD